ncbi:MAG: TerB N-terminal domain-containing protein [Clostridia bacterium]|nr:TerB N-terminal domain-containing protein [Clostridia bacterium]
MDNENYKKKDDFWAIEKLVPRREKPKFVRQTTDTSAVEFELSAGNEKKDVEQLSLSFDKATSQQYEVKRPQEEPDDEYSPACPLIEKVCIYRWKNNYNYYEEFRRDARRFYRASIESALPVPYFSYVPQYVQLSRDQLKWYVYWRGCVRRGSYPATDYSYILLLITEIINLGDEVDTLEGQRILCELHRNYRDSYPRLNSYLSDWICDYSLIHHLPPPRDIDQSLTEHCSLREFYVFFEGDNAADNYASLLIKYCSSYDYKKSKFAVEDNRKVYDRHVSGALAYTIERCSESGSILSRAGLESNMITRDAYSGALCASEMKRKLKIHFLSFSRSHELRFLIADIIKYSENKIRAYLGIKSRLSVFGIPSVITQTLDEYFSEQLPVIKRAPFEAEAALEEYDRLYEQPKTELSFENAADIEQRSWSTTQMLVEAFEEEIANEPAEQPTVASINSEADGQNDLRSALGDSYEFVLLALSEDFAGQARLAKRTGVMTDAIADKINDIAVELLGDIILEDSNGGYTIIENYKGLFNDE